MADTDIEAVEWKGYKIFFRKGTEDENVLNHSFDRDIFYKEIPSFNPTDAPVIFDVGAHIGTFSLLTAGKFPGSKIFAFEACKETYDLFQLNIRSNNFSNIEAHHRAVAESEGEVKLYYSENSGNWGHSITSRLSDASEIVSAVNLSRFLDERNIHKVDLIKFNCEGAEFEIIMSMPNVILRRFHLALVLYHLDLADPAFTLKGLDEKFLGNGFFTQKIFQTKDRGWLIAWNKDRYSKRLKYLLSFKNRLRGIFK